MSDLSDWPNAGLLRFMTGAAPSKKAGLSLRNKATANCEDPNDNAFSSKLPNFPAVVLSSNLVF